MQLLFQHPVSFGPPGKRTRIPAFPLLSTPSRADRATGPSHTTGFVPDTHVNLPDVTHMMVSSFHSAGASCRLV
jgi:hypothetical protein